MDSDNEEKPHDLSGFTGDFHRVKEKLEPMPEAEIYKIIASDEKNFAEFMRIIKYIDKDHNGYITSTEMDDIIK
jgi:Ca2+-binding EF-hand superfamily protein